MKLSQSSFIFCVFMCIYGWVSELRALVLSFSTELLIEDVRCKKNVNSFHDEGIFELSKRVWMI